MTDANTPILVGVGQVTENEVDLAKASSPLNLLEQASWKAIDDAGLDRRQIGDLDALVIVKCFQETTRNSPEALANSLGASSATRWLTPDGGNGPQYLVNRFSETIANGESRFVLFAGAEAIDTASRLQSKGEEFDWSVASNHDPNYLYPDRDMSSAQEKTHDMYNPAHVYPLFENALRHHYGNSIDEHQKVMGELFAAFTEVAATSKYAWFPQRRSAHDIAIATSSNRYVGWPYTKFMNAMNRINQSAALLLTSVEYAMEQGIDESQWVYLHGCADTTEIWNVSERVNYYSSPAIRMMGEQALKMAGMRIDDIDLIDLYSCFPCAVEIARDELGIGKDDSRSLTVTGGLPYHGGAGNNYVMNSIATMVEKLRQSRGKFGLVTANGGYLSKHAAGIYSTVPTKGHWHRQDPREYQRQIDEIPHPVLVAEPEGKGIIETYTVVFGREGEPENGIVIGRLGDNRKLDSPRFLANISADTEMLKAMTREDFIGRSGRVRKQGDLNIFAPDM